MTTKTVEELLQNIGYNIEKNIERNCEDTEFAISGKIESLEKRLVKMLGSNSKYTIHNKTDIVNNDDNDNNDNNEDNEDNEDNNGDNEDNDNNEDNEDNENNEDNKKNVEQNINEEEREQDDGNKTKLIADKFEIPSRLTERRTDIVARIKVMESMFVDTNLRLDEMDHTIKTFSTKINELIKVNNSILKRLESGAQLKKKTVI